MRARRHGNCAGRPKALLLSTASRLTVIGSVWHCCRTSDLDWSVLAYAKHTSSRAAETMWELREENDWKNDLILFWMPSNVRYQALHCPPAGRTSRHQPEAVSFVRL